MPKCIICKEKFKPKYSSFEKSCQEPECVNEYNAKLAEASAEKRRHKPVDLKLKKFYTIPKVSKTNKVIQKQKGIAEFKAELQKEINSIVRELDKGHNCICSGLPFKIITAGHYFGVGANETLRFNLINIWGQEFESNGYKGGENIAFKAGLINLYGQDFFNRLESLKSMQPIKLSEHQLIDKISICRGILKWLKLQDRKFSTSERLTLRIEFNERINIY